MDRTTKKQLGVEPGRGVTTAGILASHPIRLADLYERAVAVVGVNLDQANLDAAKFVINHADGSPTQKIQHSGKIEGVPNYIDISKLTTEEKDALRSLIKKAHKGQ